MKFSQKDCWRRAIQGDNDKRGCAFLLLFMIVYVSVCKVVVEEKGMGQMEQQQWWSKTKSCWEDVTITFKKKNQKNPSAAFLSLPRSMRECEGNNREKRTRYLTIESAKRETEGGRERRQPLVFKYSYVIINIHMHSLIYIVWNPMRAHEPPNSPSWNQCKR